MYENEPKDYSTDKVNYLNVYDPVKYMLENQRRHTVAMVDDKISKFKNEKEGGTLIRNGYLLEKVEGNRFYDYFLYYNDRKLLEYFVTVNKETGRTEQWMLHFAPNGHLLRYEYDLVNEGVEEEYDDSDALWEGWGESIDYYL